MPEKLIGWMRSPAVTVFLAVITLCANVVMFCISHVWQIEQQQQDYRVLMEQRLTRLETKMDQLLFHARQAQAPSPKGLPRRVTPDP